MNQQYKQQPGGATEMHTQPAKISEETKQIRSVEATVKQLQDMVNSQQQEILRLHRDLGRLKSHVDDVINMVRSRG